MSFFDRSKAGEATDGIARSRATRQARPTLEAMEGRQLPSTMVPALSSQAGGAVGTVYGQVVRYQDNGAWTNLGNSNVTSVVDTKNALGQEEIFARRSDGSIWSYTPASPTWKDTGGHLDSMAGATVGIIGTAGGNLFHYQDGTGWAYTGGHNVVSVVESRNPMGQEELFAKLTDNSIWSYTFATGAWASTGRVMSTLTSNVNGVYGVTSDGYLYHYQDNTGWTYTGGVNVDTVVESRNPVGQEEMFVRTRSSEIWTYNSGTGGWANTGGHLDRMIANVDGISGLSNGMLFHYQDNTGWYYTNGSNINSVVDSRNPYGQEVMIARHNDGTVWEWTPSVSTAWRGVAPYLD